MKKVCVSCETIFEGRSDAKYCSGDCRVVGREKLNFPSVCVFCGSHFSSKKSGSKFCTKKCRSDYNNNKILLEKQKDFKEGEYVVCLECGLKVGIMTSHIAKHDMTLDQYKSKHSLTNESCYSQKYLKESSDRISGENNPGYQHGGKFSPFSEKFIKYDEKKCEESKRKAAKNRVNVTSSLRYWLNKGYTEEESKTKLSDRQRTFTLKKCIDKHGEEKGTVIWKKRQDKWQHSLSLLPNEEKIRILKSKTNRGVSALEKEILEFFQLNEIEVESQFALLGDHKNWVYDFRVGDKLIECNGDYYHCNPEIYVKTFVNKIKNLTASQIWESDERKKNDAINSGYNFYTIWEKDFKERKEETLQKLLEFVNG